MGKVSHAAGGKYSISFDALLRFIVVLIPVAMFFLTAEGDNPYVDRTTAYEVTIISLFLLVVMRINQYVRIPILEVFIVVYILFWHLRFLTLTLLPKGELTLSRTTVVNHEIFNDYVWVVLISVIAVVIGIYVAHINSHSRNREAIDSVRRHATELSETVSGNVRTIFIYCLFALFYRLVTTQWGEDAQPLLLGYLSFLFPFNLILLLSALVLQNKDISRQYRLLFLVYLIVYVVFSMATGSRSILLYLVLSGLFLSSIFNIKIKVRFWHFILIFLLSLVLIIGFAVGTFQRHMRSVSGFTVNAESTQYILERIGDLDEVELWQPLLGVAFGRAGYLDFSAELFANPRYGEVVTFPNVAKSAIDVYIPGAIFEDSTRIAYRLRDIYDPHAEGYQSDALGAVGENYLLFGYAFPCAIAFVAFVFTRLYYAVSAGVYGTFIRFSTAIWLMTWWNSFGYDWLLLDIGRQLLFGTLIIALIFRNRGKVSPRIDVLKRG